MVCLFDIPSAVGWDSVETVLEDDICLAACQK